MQKQERRLSCLLNFPVAALIAVLLCEGFAWAGPGERTVYTFAGGSAGGNPFGTMIFGKTGSLYGVAGDINGGTIFKLTPSGQGSWTESVIYIFSNSPGPSLAFDSTGNLYGTLLPIGSYPCGAIYQLVPSTGGGWTENILSSFSNSTTDGCIPTSLVFDPATGNLYGTAQSGGAFGGGTVFELTPAEGGGWNFNPIYSFVNNGRDGLAPVGTLTLDSSGNLYGTTNGGGSYENGTVFRLTHNTGGWVEDTLYNFTGGDNGSQPVAGVTLDRQGNLYGTTHTGAGDNVGNVFKLTPTKGDWVIHVIHTFTGGTDGGYPSIFNLAIDSAGSLYGTTFAGGLYDYGTAFRLTPSTHGSWKETILHAFTNGADGGSPNSGVVFGSSGNFYGTTLLGGANGYGVVFEGRR